MGSPFTSKTNEMTISGRGQESSSIFLVSRSSGRVFTSQIPGPAVPQSSTITNVLPPPTPLSESTRLPSISVNTEEPRTVVLLVLPLSLIWLVKRRSSLGYRLR